MKKNYKIFGVVVALVSLIFANVSCDKLDQPYTKTETFEVVDTTTGIFDGVKKVLLEDYTAIRCVNCPSAAAKAHELMENNPGRVISLEIHGGSLAAPMTEGGVDFTTDFRTEAGNAYYAKYQIEAQPAGMIDKVKNGNAYSFMVNKWAENVSARLATPCKVGIDVKSMINGGKLSLKVYYKAMMELEESDYQLLIYFVEDGVISNQKNSNPAYGTVPVISDFVHHNVLRGTISNSPWGEEIETPTNEQVIKLMEYVIPNYSSEAKYKVIAVIYDSNEVLQAEEFEVQ